jgi:hypothetical protein
MVADLVVPLVAMSDWKSSNFVIGGHSGFLASTAATTV